MNGQVSVWFASVVLGVCVFLATVAGWGIGAWQRRTSWEEEEVPELTHARMLAWVPPEATLPSADQRAAMYAELGDGTPPLLFQPVADDEPLSPPPLTHPVWRNPQVGVSDLRETPAQRRRAKHKRRGPYAPQGEYLETALTWQARQAMAAREVREWVAGEMAFLVEVRLPRWLDWSDLEGAAR